MVSNLRLRFVLKRLSTRCHVTNEVSSTITCAAKFPFISLLEYLALPSLYTFFVIKLVWHLKQTFSDIFAHQSDLEGRAFAFEAMFVSTL